MPYPNSPEKHDWEALVTPGASIEYFRDDTELVPESVVLCFHDGLCEHVSNEYEVEPFDSEGEGYVLAATDERVGLVRVPGVGAPVTALVMEKLIAKGAKRFISVGHVGSLQPDVALGDFVIANRALRDEGTSHHYVEPTRFIDASSGLCERLEAALDAAGTAYRIGPTWTTDAIYRETVPEIERYREDGILTVDMEAAAIFSIGERRGVEAGALFTISDHLDPTGWEPRFAETQEHLERAFEIAVGALSE